MTRRNLQGLLWLLLLWVAGCGLSVGVETRPSGPYPLPLRTSVNLLLSDLTGPGFGEFRVRRYFGDPLFTELGLGGYLVPFPGLWQTPVPLPAPGASVGLVRFDLDTSVTWITGLFGQVGVEWILWRNGKRPSRIAPGDFMWLYLHTYAKALYAWPRGFLPTLGIELGFRIRGVPSL